MVTWTDKECKEGAILEFIFTGVVPRYQVEAKNLLWMHRRICKRCKEDFEDMAYKSKIPYTEEQNENFRKEGEEWDGTDLQQSETQSDTTTQQQVSHRVQGQLKTLDEF